MASERPSGFFNCTLVRRVKKYRVLFDTYGKIREQADDRATAWGNIASALGVSGRTSHCFTCRSRGPLGDCRDAFPYNETTAEGVRGVEATPCASKWCGKLVEGKDDDFDLATERLCLQRPPDDQEERCAETLYQNRRVYMCFCRGDLCNGAHTVKATGSSTIALILATTAVARYMMQAGL